MNQPLVSIRCMVYNHEPYLRQCLDGFVMQKTSFAFEAIVHDDASTDGSAAIIREYAEKYPDIIKPIYEKENQYSKYDGSLRRILNAAIHPAAKYIAMCEGDDYWIDPLKLQKQVDFLEGNPEYSLCFHNAMEHYENGIKEDKCFSNIEDRDYSGVEIYEKWIVPTASVVFRKSIMLYDRYEEVMSNKNFINKDIILFLLCVESGKVRGMKDIMSVYRRHDKSMTADHSVEKTLLIANQQLEIYRVFGSDYKRSISYHIRCNCAAFCRFLYQSHKFRFDLLVKSFKLSPVLTLKIFFGYIIQKLRNVKK